MTTAYNQGQVAARRKSPRSGGPYIAGTNGWHDWLAGYDFQIGKGERRRNRLRLQQRRAARARLLQKADAE